MTVPDHPVPVNCHLYFLALRVSMFLSWLYENVVPNKGINEENRSTLLPFPEVTSNESGGIYSQSIGTRYIPFL